MNINIAMITCAALAASPAFGADPQPANMGAPPAASAPEAPAATPAPAGSVARAQFTSEVRDREPADRLTSLPNTGTRIYFFTELKDLAGQTVTHRWEHNGKVMAEVPIEVGSARWRAFSSKTLDPGLTGEWKASVIDAGGGTLSASTFSYQAPAAAPSSTTAPASPAAATR